MTTSFFNIVVFRQKNNLPKRTKIGYLLMLQRYTEGYNWLEFTLMCN